MGTSNIYEAGDSSYLQLIDYGSSLLVRTKDGTQLWYQPIGSDYQCNQIKDRNGNYISTSYNSYGRIASVTDTAGRVIAFNYDTYQNLSTITQNWRRDSPSGPIVETHIWASFGWSRLIIQTSFSGLTLSGVQNGQTISVLTQVGFADNSRYNFEYTAWGQVATIRNYAANNILLNYVTYNLDTSVGQTDCPRFTQRRDYARDWNSDIEAVTNFTPFNPASGVADMTAPDGTLYREYFYTTSWPAGLTYQSEIWSGGNRKKWTYTYWTQDNPYLTYQLNPRPYDIRIYDEAGNQHRTTIDYTSYGLPSNIREYAADGATVLRRKEIQYRPDVDFINRHILNVVWMELTYEGEGTLVSKLNFHHDWDYFAPATYGNGQAPSVGHDGPNYSAPFFGRANITGIRRYNVDAPNDDTQAVWIKRIGYNLAGEPFFIMDAQDHRVSLSYADSYSDGNNSRNTLAYPTTITDGDNYSSTTQYNYDMGVVTRTQDPKGAVQTFAYDGAGRAEKVTNQTNGAYQRWVYVNTQQVLQYTTIQEGAGEAFNFTIYDGVGRVRATGGNLPPNADRYWAKYHVSDVMGRLVQQSNPTEITGTWTPTGDDAPGWVWSYQSYDWKGRPLVTTNADGTTKQASYDGCGCAGGERITLTDEVGRTQKLYHDVLGRELKTEVLNADGTVYSTVVNSYNARDQITNVKQYTGPEGGGTYQETVMTYDGFSRLASRKVPEQTSPTTYSYYADDTLQTVTDARGASTTYVYNNRHLVTNINYSVPAGVAPTANVSFNYDEAGNRLWMIDGQGRVDYQYNTLSRLTSETRTFNDFPYTPYAISYDYNLGGELKSITDPLGVAINYNYDMLGRLSSVSGTGLGSISQLAYDMQYRAWGALKHVAYNSTRSLNLSYNSRLLMTRQEIVGQTQTLGATYEYYADGLLYKSHDLTDSIFDHSYSYDHVGRITQALSGSESRGINVADGPYRQTYSYDVWGNTTGRTGRHWSQNIPSMTATYNQANNRNQDPTWQYDAEGNVTREGARYHDFDVEGRHTRAYVGTNQTTYGYDGDGRRVKRTNPGWVGYEIRSSVLDGRMIVELNPQGQLWMRYIYANGVLLASQMNTGQLTWNHRAPNGSSEWYALGTSAWRAGEYDPTGTSMNTYDPYLEGEGGGGDAGGGLGGFGFAGNYSSGCALDYNPISCDWVLKFYNRERHIFITKTITAMIGVRSPATSASQHHDSSSIMAGSGSRQDPKSGNYTAYVNVVGRPSVFETAHLGFTRSWVNMLPIQQIQKGPETPLSPKDTVSIYRGLKNIGRYFPACSNFIKGVLEKLQELNPNNPPESTDIVKLFRMVQNQASGGFFTSSRGYSTVQGRIKSGNGMVLLHSSRFVYVSRAIHEMFHLAGQNRDFSDQDVAKAIAQIDDDARKRYDSIDPTSKGAGDLYSYSIDGALAKYCSDSLFEDLFK